MIALNFQIQGQGKPIIVLHGLFGSLSNVNAISNLLSKNHTVYQLDLRNHGLSPWTDEMNYSLMAEDIRAFMMSQAIENAVIVGHSMGGKVAMTLAQLYPEKVSQLFVLDIAPITYSKERHNEIFSALNGLYKEDLADRMLVTETLKKKLPAETVQFLIKYLKNGQWQFNVNALFRHYDEICQWRYHAVYMGKTVFIKGEQSDYIGSNANQSILTQFPRSSIITVKNTGHYLHVEKPDIVSNIILKMMM